MENVELPYDKLQSKRRAFCFVCFETEKAATDAAAQPKQVVPPMTKHCDVKIATPPKPEGYGFQPMFAGRGRDRFRGGKHFVYHLRVHLKKLQHRDKFNIIRLLFKEVNM